ncbi:cysteine desulfurase NifS [Candidatus Pacearchaeota archaeon RBG_13_36_9]|nr:MAG: cysteine desulfurase NifS [Candidatus Pacearchaeota archaeon RBG_13_36_9]
MKTIYLDNAATTPVDERVMKAMMPYFSGKYGNVSSMHAKGQEAKEAVENARQIIAGSIGALPEEIYFTSGGTESNNLALKGLFFENEKKGKDHIITTKAEHDCIFNTCKWLEKQGAEVTYLNVDSEGFINVEELKKAIKKNTLVVSVIHGNNEIGTINDLEAIGKICREKNVLLHTDACQSYTKTKLDVRAQNIDLATLNAHKIHGPKGIGALYIRKGVRITPLLHGGGHEKGMRSGTENVPGIVGFGKAAEIIDGKQVKQMEKLRNKLIDGILKIENTKLNGAKEKRLCNNVNICFGNIEGESINGYLEEYGICSSTGSACSSHTLEPSHVLRAIGRSHLEANSSIRLTLSRENTEEDVNKVLEVLPGIVNKLRRMSPFKI